MAYETAANFVINDIMQKGSQMLYQNYLQKHKATGFAADNFVEFTNQLLMQTGASRQKFQHIKLDNKPKPIQRQSFNTQSLKKVQRKQINQQNWDLSSPRSRKTQSNLFQKRASIKYSNTELIRKRSNAKQQKFVPLTVTNDKKKLQDIKKQQQQQDKIRTKLIDAQQRNKIMEIQKLCIQRQKLQRQKQLKDEYEKKMSNHDTSFTFDTNGQILYSNHRIADSRNRHYPPKTKYRIQKDFDEQIQEKLSRKEKYQNQKIKAAEGGAFASCVMKTMNISQISMNATMKDNDAHTFMMRNDLFNNNHSRQTSSIPYMHLNAGTSYTEKQTNITVANLQQSTIQRTNSYLTKRSGKQKLTQNERANKSYTAPRSAKVSVVYQKDIFQKRDIKTGEPSTRRTYSLRRPRTSIQTGRITTNNEQLVQQLFC